MFLILKTKPPVDWLRASFKLKLERRLAHPAKSRSGFLRTNLNSKVVLNLLHPLRKTDLA